MTVFILIGGIAGSGKTPLAKNLYKILKNSGVHTRYISIDDYYINGKLSNFESPESIDWILLRKNIKDILIGKKHKEPKYDFKKYSSTYIEKQDYLIKALIIEGLHALNINYLNYKPSYKIKINLDISTELSREIWWWIHYKRPIYLFGEYWENTKRENMINLNKTTNNADIVLNFGRQKKGVFFDRKKFDESLNKVYNTILKMIDNDSSDKTL